MEFALEVRGSGDCYAGPSSRIDLDIFVFVQCDFAESLRDARDVVAEDEDELVAGDCCDDFELVKGFCFRSVPLRATALEEGGKEDGFPLSLLEWAVFCAEFGDAGLFYCRLGISQSLVSMGRYRAHMCICMGWRLLWRGA